MSQPRFLNGQLKISECCESNRNNGKKKTQVTAKGLITSTSISKDVHIRNTYGADLETLHAGIWFGLDGQSALK